MRIPANIRATTVNRPITEDNAHCTIPTLAKSLHVSRLLFRSSLKGPTAFRYTITSCQFRGRFSVHGNLYGNTPFIRCIADALARGSLRWLVRSNNDFQILKNLILVASFQHLFKRQPAILLTRKSENAYCEAEPNTL